MKKVRSQRTLPAGTGESGGLPADPGHGGLCHQHRLLVRQQLDAVREAQVLHHHRQLFGLRVVLEDAERTQQVTSDNHRRAFNVKRQKQEVIIRCVSLTVLGQQHRAETLSP